MKKIMLFVLLLFVIKAKGQSDSIQRVEAKNKWLYSAEKLCNLVHDSEAYAVLKLLCETGLAVPMGKVVHPIVPAKNGILFMPVMADDAVDSLFVNKNAFAEYNNYTIFVRAFVECSEFWKGIALLHEGRHALMQHPGTIFFESLEAQSAEEEEVYSFGFRIIEKAGGNSYRALLGKEMARIRLALSGNVVFKTREQEQELFSVLAGPIRYSEIDSIPEPVLSDDERNVRYDFLWMNAVFKVFEEDFGIWSEMLKSDFILFSYQKQGLLPK